MKISTDKKKSLTVGECIIVCIIVCIITVLILLFSGFAMYKGGVYEEMSGSGVVTHPEENFETTYEKGNEEAISNLVEECIDGSTSSDNSVMENTSSTYEPSTTK